MITLNWRNMGLIVVILLITWVTLVFALDAIGWPLSLWAALPVAGAWGIVGTSLLKRWLPIINEET